MKICRKFITLKNGKRLYASSYGLQAFCFDVTPEQYKEYMEKRKRKKSKTE